MKIRIKIFMISSIMALSLIYGCEEDKKEPLVKNDSIPPEVERIGVENLPGGAKITYTLPEKSDILYVTAEFSSRKNEIRTIKSSVYNNFLLLEGFAEEKEYPVTLYTVSRSEVRSKGVDTTIQPQKAPLSDVFETLDIYDTFGGVLISFVNEAEKEYILHTLIKDEETGEWMEYDRLYTNSKNRLYAVRELESKLIDFGFYFSDKWKNNSDTLFKSLTPLYEIPLDRDLWQNMKLSDDTWLGVYGWNVECLWIVGPDPFFYTPAGTTFPCWFTLDLGQRYKFSRMRVHQMNRSTDDTWRFAGGAPQIYEIWATNTPTTNWDDWTLLERFESIKPSGLPLGQLSDEDRALITAGEEYDFQPMEDSYQYIRFKTFKTWGNADYLSFGELYLWGQ